MPDSSSSEQSKPTILDTLPDFPISNQRSIYQIQQKLDLILLAIEALELGASEYMLTTLKDLQLDNIVKNRVDLWRIRCTNPWRRAYNREVLSLDRLKVLAILVTDRSKQKIVLIRQLLLSGQQMTEKGLPLDTNFILFEYLERFKAHFKSRMNPRRAKVSVLLDSEDLLNELAISLLNQLLFCTGTSGLLRYWVSLFDGEVK